MSNSDNDDTGHYEGATLEDIRDQIQRLAEAMADVPHDVKWLKADVGQLKQDVTVIKAVVTDQNKDLNRLGDRVSRLEEAAVSS